MKRKLNRRSFLASGSGIGGAWVCSPGSFAAGIPKRDLEAGQGAAEITPAVGTVLSGFHYAPGKERRVEGVRQPTFARTLVLRYERQLACILSVDVLAVSEDMTRRVQRLVSRRTGMPEQNVRICATHSHSTPTLHFCRQWGGLPKTYQKTTEQLVVQAVERAVEDLSPAELYVGQHRAIDANFNRTAKTWKTDEQFRAEADDTERWLDTSVHVLHFERLRGKRNLLWYHFSAHPVCYNDRMAGPDWPGVVQTILQDRENVEPSFLQGHCGDVNPGNGKPWLGVAEETGIRVASAIQNAVRTAKPVRIDALPIATKVIEIPLDMEWFSDQLARYRNDPSKCSGGEYVDAQFAEDWYARASQWNLDQASLMTSISVIQLGGVGLVFHASELFSYYGLRIRHASPFDETIVVGYCDGFVGYLTDPASHRDREYASAVVPKILDYPPFQADAAQHFTNNLGEFLNESARAN